MLLKKFGTAVFQKNFAVHHQPVFGCKWTVISQLFFLSILFKLF